MSYNRRQIRKEELEMQKRTKDTERKHMRHTYPAICVWSAHTGKTVLYPPKHMPKCVPNPESIEGIGTRRRPFTLPAMDIHPYWAIVYLWRLYRTHSIVRKTGTWIKVNDWLLGVGMDGIWAHCEKDGQVFSPLKNCEK